MHTDGTDPLQAPAWVADMLRQLGQGGPLTAGALTERLQTTIRSRPPSRLSESCMPAVRCMRRRLAG
jgi:hypothetical protein